MFILSGEINIRGAKENPVLMKSEIAGKPWRGVDIRNTTRSMSYLQHYLLFAIFYYKNYKKASVRE
jgi:hypothetical protein